LNGEFGHNNNFWYFKQIYTKIKKVQKMVKLGFDSFFHLIWFNAKLPYISNQIDWNQQFSPELEKIIQLWQQIREIVCWHQINFIPWILPDVKYSKETVEHWAKILGMIKISFSSLNSNNIVTFFNLLRGLEFSKCFDGPILIKNMYSCGFSKNATFKEVYRKKKGSISIFQVPSHAVLGNYNLEAIQLELLPTTMEAAKYLEILFIQRGRFTLLNINTKKEISYKNYLSHLEFSNYAVIKQKSIIFDKNVHKTYHRYHAYLNKLMPNKILDLLNSKQWTRSSRYFTLSTTKSQSYSPVDSLNTLLLCSGYIPFDQLRYARGILSEIIKADI
jgi:hypothetical protein